MRVHGFNRSVSPRCGYSCRRFYEILIALLVYVFSMLAGINTGVMYVLVSSYSALTASSTYDFTWSYSGGAYPPSPSNRCVEHQCSCQ